MAVLAIDQGTTGTTAALFSEKGIMLGRANFEFPQHFPKPGWVEHNPDEIWRSVELAVSELLKKLRFSHVLGGEQSQYHVFN